MLLFATFATNKLTQTFLVYDLTWLILLLVLAPASGDQNAFNFHVVKGKKCGSYI